jgi:hypothetical protein
MATERKAVTEMIQRANATDLTEVKLEKTSEVTHEKSSEVKVQRDKPVQQTSEDMRMENKEFEARFVNTVKPV